MALVRVLRDGGLESVGEIDDAGIRLFGGNVGCVTGRSFDELIALTPTSSFEKLRFEVTLQGGVTLREVRFGGPAPMNESGTGFVFRKSSSG